RLPGGIVPLQREVEAHLAATAARSERPLLDRGHRRALEHAGRLGVDDRDALDLAGGVDRELDLDEALGTGADGFGRVLGLDPLDRLEVGGGEGGGDECHGQRGDEERTQHGDDSLKGTAWGLPLPSAANAGTCASRGRTVTNTTLAECLPFRRNTPPGVPPRSAASPQPKVSPAQADG